MISLQTKFYTFPTRNYRDTADQKYRSAFKMSPVLLSTANCATAKGLHADDMPLGETDIEGA
jgi:hypothetical protein